MSFLRIAPGIGGLSDTGHVLPRGVLKPSDDMRAKIFERDDNTCRYCGFYAKKYQDTNYIKRGGKDAGKNPAAPVLDDYVTACTFCQQCFNLERIDRMQSGAIIWLPEIGQATLHHICRAIYVARISQGPMADAARDAMEALLARKEEAKNRLGTESVKVLATIFQDFFEGPEYKNRLGKMKGFRILPLDRRIIREGELEFNQFPQMLAYWRSKDGPFGAMPPRQWPEMFYEMRKKLAAAPLAAKK